MWALDEQRALSPASHWRNGSSLIHRVQDAALISYLIEQRLAPYWHFRVTSDSFAEASFSSQFIDGLRQARVSSAIAYMAQHDAIRVIDFTVGSIGIVCALIKGAHAPYRSGFIRSPPCDLLVM